MNVGNGKLEISMMVGKQFRVFKCNRFRFRSILNALILTGTPFMVLSCKAHNE